MRGVNKAIILGRLGRDPKAYGSGDKKVVKFSVATSDVKSDEEVTHWHEVSTFGKLAELCEKYTSKGSTVYVEGRMNKTTYEKDGVEKVSFNIVAHTVQFLSPKKEKEQGASADAPF